MLAMEASAAKPSKPGKSLSASVLLGLSVALRALVALAFGAAATLGLLGFDWPHELVVALFAMAGFVVVETLVLFLWARPYISGYQGGGAASLGNAYPDAAKIAITTQGVVLGLITFQEGQLPNTTLKVAAVTLVAGVLVAGVLYLNVAFGSPPDAPRAFAAAILFSLAYWCLGFGLICVVAGTWT